MLYLDDPLCKLCIYILKIFVHSEDVSLFLRMFVTFSLILILSAAITFQVANMVEIGLEMQVIVENVPTTTVLIICLICLYATYMRKSICREVVNVLESDYTKPVSQKEREMIQKQLKSGRMLVNLIVVGAFLGSIGVTLTGFISQFLDIIAPLNESRLRVLPFHGKHFVDDQEYFYVILFFQCLTILTVVTIVSSIESGLVMMVHHACGLFALSGYQMEHVMDSVDVITSEEKVDLEKTVIWAIRRSIETHREALHVVLLVESSGKELLFTTMIATLVAFSVSLVQVTNVELVDVKSALFSAAQISQFYILNHVGQQLIIESMKLPMRAYFARWYECPPQIQKLFVLLILRTHKDCAINLCDMGIMSLQTFSSVSQTALSYCMVLRQFQ